MARPERTTPITWQTQYQGRTYLLAHNGQLHPERKAYPLIVNMHPSIRAHVRCVLITDDGPQEGKWDAFSVPVIAFDADGYPMVLGNGGRLQRAKDWINSDPWYPGDKATITVIDSRD